ncbi:VOC family protein [Brevibacillus fluminis]|uniref:VOC family protein n=1 Tax=Brevibacillus fluminis TaxID=511487 RepID=UPI003F8A0A86
MAMNLTPYLMMNDGKAKDAIAYYEKVLEGKVLFQQSFGEMPANPEFPLPEAAKDLVAHAMMQIGESTLMFSDTFPGQTVPQGGNVTICITIPTKEKAEQIFAALQDGGQVIMPFQETHFSPGYGIVTDKFGVPFQIFTESQQG